MMVRLMVGRSSALSYNARAEMVVPSNSQFALHGRRAQLSEVGVEEIQNEFAKAHRGRAASEFALPPGAKSIQTAAGLLALFV
jgi:hypothetical protein